MAKRNPTKTPQSKIRSALRALFLRSRERAAAMKASGYKCKQCGKKQSKAKGKEVKVEVHHGNGIDNWKIIIDAVYEYLLCDPRFLIPLCEECHDKIHEGEKSV